MSIDDWKGLRKKWVSARDAAKPKVAQGAVKGVSMGDTIDAVYKAAEKNYTALEKAIQELGKNTTKYKNGIKAKNPDLAKWIEANIDGAAKKLLTDAQSDVKHLHDAIKFYGTFNERKESYFPGNLVALSVQVSQENKSLKAIAPKEYKALVQATAFYSSIGKMLQKTAGDLALTLPKNDLRAKLKEHGHAMDHDVGTMMTVVKASDGVGFDQVLRGNNEVPDLLWDHAKDSYNTIKAAIGS